MTRRFALCSYGSTGDVRPFVALGLALARRGHEVSICAPEDFEPLVTSHGLAFRAVTRDFLKLLAGTGNNAITVLRKMRVATGMQFDDLPDAAREADVIVGTGALLAGPTVAESMDVPYVYVALCPRVLRSVQHASPAFPWNDGPAWANSASWWMNDLLWNRATLGVVNEKRAVMGLDPIPTLFGHVIPDDSILAADAALAPLPADLARVEQTGPLVMIDESPLPDEVEDFVADEADVVYMGFGSMDAGTSSRAARAALGAVPRAGLRAVISSGLTAPGAPARCLAAGALNHSRLFPRMRAIVHHGGAGTFHAAALAGVPQVVVPQVVDQFYWAGRAHALGIGPAPVPAWRLTARGLAAALRRCVQDAGMVERAREVARGIERGGAERCAEVLEARGT